jgi:hypothetical protein
MEDYRMRSRPKVYGVEPSKFNIYSKKVKAIIRKITGFYFISSQEYVFTADSFRDMKAKLNVFKKDDEFSIAIDQDGLVSIYLNRIYTPFQRVFVGRLSADKTRMNGRMKMLDGVILFFYTFLAVFLFSSIYENLVLFLIVCFYFICFLYLCFRDLRTGSSYTLSKLNEGFTDVEEC